MFPEGVVLRLGLAADAVAVRLCESLRAGRVVAFEPIDEAFGVRGVGRDCGASSAGGAQHGFKAVYLGVQVEHGPHLAALSVEVRVVLLRVRSLVVGQMNACVGHECSSWSSVRLRADRTYV